MEIFVLNFENEFDYTCGSFLLDLFLCVIWSFVQCNGKLRSVVGIQLEMIGIFEFDGDDIIRIRYSFARETQAHGTFRFG